MPAVGGRLRPEDWHTAIVKEVNMDWARLQAALIRAFWTIVFPLIGALVVWLQNPDNLKIIGVANSTAILLIGAVLYGLKKLIWPNTVL
jgi:hypothetical protein